MTPFRPGDRVLLLPALTPGQVLEGDVRINKVMRGVTVQFDGRPVPTVVPMQHLLLDPNPPKEAA